MNSEIIENSSLLNTQNEQQQQQQQKQQQKYDLLNNQNTFQYRSSRTPSQITIKSILTPQTARETSTLYSPTNRVPSSRSVIEAVASKLNEVNLKNQKMSLAQRNTYEYDPDLFLSMMDDDVALYKRYFPTQTTKFSRYLDFNDDTLVLDRLKAKLEQRDYDMTKRLNDGKEINVLIDITTDGKKVRHQVKSRNSQEQQGVLKPVKSRNEDGAGDEENQVDIINPKGYANKKRLLHQSLPNIAPRHVANRSRKEMDDQVGVGNELVLKQQNARESIHDHLYSLAKKDPAGYFETYKENQRRKMEMKNKKYSIEDYKRFTSNFGLGKDYFDLKDVVKVQEQERARKRNDYAEYVQNRNSQILNQMNPKDSLKQFIHSKNPVLRNAFAMNENQKLKEYKYTKNQNRHTKSLQN